MERLGDWVRSVAIGLDGKLVAIVSCPACGAAMLHHDTQALARHALWHHDRGEWPWERM